MKDETSTDERDEQGGTTISRRSLLKGAGVAGVSAVTVSGGAVAAGTPARVPDALSPAVYDSMGFSFQAPRAARRYGPSANPEFLVTVKSGRRDSLDSWIASSDARVLRKEVSTSEVVIAAPPVHVAASKMATFGLDDTLVSREYVQSIDYNLAYETQEVDELASQSEWTPPNGAELITLLKGGAFDSSGLAFRDNSTAGKLADARGHMGVDDVTEDGSGITLAVLDSGCNTASDSSVFGTRIQKAKNFVNGNTGVSAVEDPLKHGTWCASAAVGSSGVAPGADLLIGKVMQDDGSGDTADIVSGIRWAVDNGADIISMSLGAPIYSEKLTSALEYATANGVVVVAAAGNSRQTVRWVASPADATANIDGVLAVGATDIAAPVDARSAYFSQVGRDAGVTDASLGLSRGASPVVAAPGVKIGAPTPQTDGTVSTDYLSGTSMSTPLVAGGLAVLMQSDSTYIGQPGAVRGYVESHSRPVPQAGVTEVGSGLLSVDLLVSGTEPDQSQEAARDSKAKQRDAGNIALSGSFIDEWMTPSEPPV